MTFIRAVHLVWFSLDHLHSLRLLYLLLFEVFHIYRVIFWFRKPLRQEVSLIKEPILYVFLPAAFLTWSLLFNSNLIPNETGPGSALARVQVAFCARAFVILLALWQGVQLFRAKLRSFEIFYLYDKQPNISPKQEQRLNLDIIPSVLTQSSYANGIALCCGSALKCRTTIQKDLERLEKWADGNLMRFSKGRVP